MQRDRCMLCFKSGDTLLPAEVEHIDWFEGSIIALACSHIIMHLGYTARFKLPRNVLISFAFYFLVRCFKPELTVHAQLGLCHGNLRLHFSR